MIFFREMLKRLFRGDVIEWRFVLRRRFRIIDAATKRFLAGFRPNFFLATNDDRLVIYGKISQSVSDERTVTILQCRFLPGSLGEGESGEVHGDYHKGVLTITFKEATPP